MFMATGRSRFHHRSFPAVALAVLFAALALLALTAPAAAQTSERCFPETGFCIAGPIRAFWERNGGLPTFGLPIAPQQEEQIEGHILQAQWFERNRLEIQLDGAITLGRLGAQRLGQQGRSWFAFPKSERQAGCRFFAETGHNVCGEILTTWQSSGLSVYGLPLSDTQTEVIGGKEYTVQWFERARFELHPENALPHRVQLGLLGREIQDGPRGTVWVVNRSTNDVTAFNVGTGEVIATIPVGKMPNSVIGPQGRDKVYVSDEGSNTVSVISKKSLRVVATIPTGPMPHHITASPNGKLVYVAEYGANKVGVIDTDLDQLVAEFTTGAPETRTHAMSVTQDGKTLFTANQVVNEIAALDALTGAIKWSLPVGGMPSEVLATTDGKIAYVSLRNDTKVQVVDLDRRAIVAEVVVGQQPDTLLLTPDGRTLVVTLRGNPAQIAIVDTANNLAVRQVNIGGTLAGHHWLSADGRYSFVAVEGPASVAVVDNQAASVVATYAYPGGGRPHGIFYEPGSLTRGG
jgi:YVTN family beta-propeller protein